MITNLLLHIPHMLALLNRHVTIAHLAACTRQTHCPSGAFGASCKGKTCKLDQQTGMVQANIDRKNNPEDWRCREAATFAFGSILEGPHPDKLVQLVNMGLPFFLNALKDGNSQVRHTTAWTIGRPLPLRFT